MMTLYGSRDSGSTAIEAALDLIGLPWRAVEAATWAPDSALDELRRVNPLGQIPTLVLDDGTVLTESAAILIYLGLVHDQSGLLPADPSRRALVIRGLVYIAANCYVAIGVIDYPERWSEPASAEVVAAIAVGARARLHRLWDVFADQFTADQFTADPWLGGERVGALDVLAAVVSRWSGARAHLAASRPAFHALLLRIEAHPALAPTFARHHGSED